MTTTTWLYRSAAAPHQDRHRLVGQALQESHFGELIQGPVYHNNRIVTAVVTLPRHDRYSIARVVVNSDVETAKKPTHATRACQGAQEVLRLAGGDMTRLGLTLNSNIRAGSGGGSSTADILATIRATCNAVHFTMSNEAMQQLCWEIEGASDPLMICRHEAVLYGSRCGTVIRYFGRPLPEMICLGFDTSSNTEVLTSSLVGRENYSWKDVCEFRRCLSLFEQGLVMNDAKTIGEAATLSAELNQPRLQTRSFEKLQNLAKSVGSIGFTISHSGTVASFLFERTDLSVCARVQDASDGLQSLGCGDISTFSVGTPNTHQLYSSILSRRTVRTFSDGG